MSHQLTFDEAEDRIREAAQRGEAGMLQASDHADRDRAGWTDDAFAAVCRAARRPGEFTFEDLRRDAERAVPAPPDLRAWGTVAKRAIRERCTPTMTYTAGGSC